MTGSRVHVRVEGRVQGVFFRYETQKKARKRGVTGWVKNLPDGRVEAVFEGEENDVKDLVEWCSVGPPGARVERVETQKEAYRGEYEEFRVTY